MKLKLIALAATAAFACSANAAKPTAAQAAAPDFLLQIHGSSALNKLVEGLVGQNCDVAADFAIWRTAKTTWFGSTTADTSDGASANVYSCVMKAGNDFNSTTENYDGKLLTFIKRDAGGSSQGVFPVAKPALVPAANRRTVNVAACDATATTVTPTTGLVYGLCPNTSEVELAGGPDMGISDQEPAVYNTTTNRASAFGTLTVADTDFEGGQATPFALGVMGLVVNGKLFADLQADQGLSGAQVPSVPSVGFANMWSNGYPLAQGWSPLCANPLNCSALTLKSTGINLAVRAIGSGTRAAAGLYMNNTPSGKIAKQWATGNTTNTFATTPAGGRSVFNASSGGNVVGAIDACGTSRYCIGILGLETSLAGKDAFFVKVDNQSPDLARFGQYGIVYEATSQVNLGASAAAKALAKNFTIAAAKPANIEAAFGGSGVLALPTACGAFPFVGTTEQTVCSRVTRNGNSNSTLIIAK